jgi:small subunit ribosomal protein S9
VSDAPSEPTTNETPATEPTPAPAPTPAAPKPQQPWCWGTGRRKTSVARVRIRPGKGEFQINGRAPDGYFCEAKDRNDIVAPLAVTETTGKMDVFVNVKGGGPTGQAGAIVLGLARALKTFDADHETPLRNAGLLTRDSRMVERKKYGQRGARRRFQFSKR